MGERRLWVFGYGSLLWNPGFEHDDREIARLCGYARSFCMWSIHHRGTRERPGLVLALDAQRGACCDGLAFRVVPGGEAAALAGLRERELISAAYLEKTVTVRLADGRRVDAVTFVVDPGHAQYCADLSAERQAQVIARARGGRGPNAEYLHNTVEHLRALGIRDDALERLAHRVRQIAGAAPGQSAVGTGALKE